MSLADRYRQPAASSNAQDFTCPHYSPVPGTKRCKDYLKGGACGRADEFMCVEWLKANGHAVPGNHPVLEAPQTDLFGNSVSVPAAPPARTSKQSKATPPAPPAPGPTNEKPKLVEPIPKDDIESFKALGVEVCLRSEEIGEVWIVPEYTDQEDRKELSVEHAATLCLVVAAFPGAKVIRFEKQPKPAIAKEPA